MSETQATSRKDGATMVRALAAYDRNSDDHKGIYDDLKDE